MMKSFLKIASVTILIAGIALLSACSPIRSDQSSTPSISAPASSAMEEFDLTITASEASTPNAVVTSKEAEASSGASTSAENGKDSSKSNSKTTDKTSEPSASASAGSSSTLIWDDTNELPDVPLS